MSVRFTVRVRVKVRVRGVMGDFVTFKGQGSKTLVTSEPKKKKKKKAVLCPRLNLSF